MAKNSGNAPASTPRPAGQGSKGPVYTQGIKTQARTPGASAPSRGTLATRPTKQPGDGTRGTNRGAR